MFESKKIGGKLSKRFQQRISREIYHLSLVFTQTKSKNDCAIERKVYLNYLSNNLTSGFAAREETEKYRVRQETKKNCRNCSSFEVIKLHNKISIGCEIRAEYHQIKKKTPCTTGAYKSTHEIRGNGDPEIVYHAFSALSSHHLSTYMRVESSERNKSDLRPSSGIKCLSIALSLDSSFQFLPKVYSNVNSFHHDEEEKFKI